jgi:hypothetical protein
MFHLAYFRSVTLQASNANEMRLYSTSRASKMVCCGDIETCSIVAYVPVCAGLCTERLRFALVVFEIVEIKAMITIHMILKYVFHVGL